MTFKSDDIVVYQGIITKYSIACILSCMNFTINGVRLATEEEISRYTYNYTR
jgi:hypothetical protein